MSTRVLLSALILTCAFWGTAVSAKVNKAERILLDTDIGTDVDDALALVLAALSPEVELLSVSTVGAKPEVRAMIAKKLLILANRPNVPVAAGLSRPLPSKRFQLPFPEGLWLGHEGKGVLSEEELNSPMSISPDAVGQIIATLRSSKERVTVVAIGPLSNIAAALQRDPQVVTKVKRFVVMGGNVLRPPRIGSHEVSPMMEFNLNADREAASILMTSGVPITLIPVELTLQSFLTQPDVDQLLRGDQPARTLANLINIWTPVLRRVYDSFKIPESAYRDLVCHLHDVLAVLAVVKPSLIKYRIASISLEEEKGILLTRAKSDGPVRVTVGESTNNDEVRSVLLQRLQSNVVNPSSSSESSLIANKHDLVPKYEKGDQDFFSYELEFTRLGPGGKILGRNWVKGYFKQEVTGFRRDGNPEFKVTRNQTRLRLTDESNKELLSSTLDFAECLTYTVCYEDPFSFFPVDATGWPRDIMGFMMFEEVYTSHQFFQTVMTRTHGGIDQLKELGARVVMPDSNKLGTLGISGLANLDVIRGESILELLGLGVYKQTPALVLSFDVPYELNIHELFGNKNGIGRELLSGLIWVSRDTSKVLGGRLRGANFVALPDGNGQLQASDVVLEGRLERLTQADYVSQSSTPKP
jgi:inosine-uridine nucleoside N-ribohydrolase